jgi:plasmid stabilization system protein ParE
MKIKITRAFRDKLNDQIDYIAQDKPSAARKFKGYILKEIKSIQDLPYRNRKSIFFDRDDIRDLIFKGYVIVYKINEDKGIIEVFGFSKWEDNPFSKKK